LNPLKYLNKAAMQPIYKTNLGVLFSADCLEVLPLIKDESIDTVFADPPFNLGKKYGRNTNDNRSDEEYIDWCNKWIEECVRTLKPGGAFFLYNLPKWNIYLGNVLFEKGMQFRHWIAVSISACLPIPGRLYPSHYSLLYYTKGKQNKFHKIRTPIDKCRHCDKEIKDYGGYRNKINPHGINLKDVWTDIPPVRHSKFKNKSRKANALSTKLLDRVVEMSTDKGDIVMDPFGGSGTTFSVCEYKERHWIGIDIDFSQEIIERLKKNNLSPHNNDDYVEDY